MAPPTILAFETATDVCSVALLRENRLVVELTLARPRVHAEFLVLLAEHALRLGDAAATDVGVIAVSAGPGSYTGLRIGVSAAKGLAFATGARLVAVPTLEALAAGMTPMADADDLLLAALDARRDDVYAAVYRLEADGNLREFIETDLFTAAALAARLRGAGRRVIAGGDAAAKVAWRLDAADLRLLGPEAMAPSAHRVARLAAARAAEGLFEDPATFEPRYLREFEAKTAPDRFERLPKRPASP